MGKFSKVTGVAAALDMVNVDIAGDGRHRGSDGRTGGRARTDRLTPAAPLRTGMRSACQIDGQPVVVGARQPGDQEDVDK